MNLTFRCADLTYRNGNCHYKTRTTLIIPDEIIRFSVPYGSLKHENEIQLSDRPILMTSIIRKNYNL